MTNADYADNLALLTNTSTQPRSLLRSLEQAVGSIELHFNVYKTEYTCFKQKGTIPTISSNPLKFVDQFK